MALPERGRVADDLHMPALSYGTQRASVPRVPPALATLVLLAGLLFALASLYAHSGNLVMLRVNGDVWRIRTHQRTVEAFLREVGLDLQPADIVMPLLSEVLDESSTIVVHKALPVLVEADGQVMPHYTHSRQVGDVVLEMGLDAKPHDVVTLNETAVDPQTSLPDYRWSPSRWPLLPWQPRPSGHAGASLWPRIGLQRAIPLIIMDGGTQMSVHTVAHTVGEALVSNDIVLFLGDRVQPRLGTLLTAGMHVEIQRAKPVLLEVDGRALKTRTQARTVAQLLSEAGVELLGKDYTSPSLDTEISPDMAVRVTRVLEDWVVEAEDIPFETVWRGDSKLELDQTHTDQVGKPGVRKRRVHIVYEDGEEKQRAVTDEWIERQPTTCIKSYGTKIVIREEDTPLGPIRYWRKVRMLATSYSASTAGKSSDHPTYGITRLGWKAAKGVVAVDPRVIKLGTRVYVPGYGLGTAADTGGWIKGRRIDLCYDDDNLVLWYKRVDVYLLEPVPPAEDIHWVLPS